MKLTYVRCAPKGTSWPLTTWDKVDRDGDWRWVGLVRDEVGQLLDALAAAEARIAELEALEPIMREYASAKDALDKANPVDRNVKAATEAMGRIAKAERAFHAAALAYARRTAPEPR